MYPSHGAPKLRTLRGRPTEAEGQRVERTVPVWLHNMVGSNWGWASGVSFIPGVDDPDNCVSVCG